MSLFVTSLLSLFNVFPLGSGAVLNFDEDTTQHSISLIIFEDHLPERDEMIIVSLSNPTGGAVLARDGEDTVTVIIEANDNAAGIIGLVDTARSAIVDEGETVRYRSRKNCGELRYSGSDVGDLWIRRCCTRSSYQPLGLQHLKM